MFVFKKKQKKQIQEAQAEQNSIIFCWLSEYWWPKQHFKKQSKFNWLCPKYKSDKYFVIVQVAEFSNWEFSLHMWEQQIL